ncbi:MAG: hypothetical protein AAF533_00155 [Acidobacteriota bacterium]
MRRQGEDGIIAAMSTRRRRAHRLVTAALGLLLLVLALPASAQVAPGPDRDRDENGGLVRPRLVFRFERPLPPRRVNRRTIQVFQDGEQVRGRVRQVGRRRAVFVPRRPMDSRRPFTWLVDPQLGPMEGAPNDFFAPCFLFPADDLDDDGIPDCYENIGQWYEGQPLYAYGARQDQTDIFIEVDYVVDPDRYYITPQWEALEKVRRAFLAKEYHVHFDAGDLYSDEYLDHERFNLGGGDPDGDDQGDLGEPTFIPWSSPNPGCGGDTGWGSLPDGNFIEDYVRVHFTAGRERSFYYILFGERTQGGVTGRAHNRSTHALITFGISAFESIFNPAGQSDEAKANQVINYQAGTLMHEFGHLLGLREGGDPNEDPADQLWGKPNHFSVMSYQYQIFGLPDATDDYADYAGDRYFFWNETCNLAGGDAVTKADLDRGPFATWDPDLPGHFRIDYSSAGAGSLDESDLDEALGVDGIPGGAAIDWNCDGDTTDSGLQRDINGNGVSSDVLHDHDDWSALILYHDHWLDSGEEWPNDGLAFTCPLPGD